MKLKNKKTGEIGELSIWHRADNNEITGFAVIKENEKFPTDYKNLAELNEEWEDYEEPKDFWFIDPEILIACESTSPLLCDKKVAIETMEQIGNYFETKEEAEKAVEKLKAWKRLKDKGFKFGGVNVCWIEFTLKLFLCASSVEDFEQGQKDLHLLFGGEE